MEEYGFKLSMQLYNFQMQKQQKKVYLDLHHSFGSNFSPQNRAQIGIIQEESKMKMVFTVGKTIAKMCIETKTMQFIRLSDQIESIQCIAISPTRNHIAVCEKIKNQNFLLLNLYGLKSKDSQIKHFKLPQTDKQSTFKIIAFSPSQPKYACCMTSEPDSQLMFLDISRSRGLAVSNFSVQGTQSISICPTQSHLISCAGKGLFRLFKVQDYSFKVYEQVKKLPKSRNFTCHAWFDKTKLLLGTDRGQLFMIGPVGNNFQVKRQLGNVFTHQGQQNISISAICVFGHGFIIGSSRGQFGLWMKGEESQQNFQDQYTGDLVRRWQVADNRIARVISIATCPLQNNIAIAFDNSTIATTSIQDLLNAQQSQHTPKLIQGQILKYLYSGFHWGSIVSMDTCLHRPIIATLSRKENSIRLWNFKNPNCQLTKFFDPKTDGIQPLSNQLIHCLSLHPLGYYMAVGCCDKLRIYHILERQLRNFREIVVRGVCCLKFSHGGQLLAAAYPRHKNSSQKNSVHLINIYNSYSLQEVGRLSDHSNIITDLSWRQDDRELYSVGIDGTATLWKPCDPRSQTKEWIGKKWTQGNARYSSVIFQRGGKSILAAGVQSGRSVVRQFRVEKDLSQKLFALGGFRVSRMQRLTSQWNIPAVLAGTQEGCLKVFNSVFDNIVQQSLNLHCKQITGICTSPCGRYVLTASKDGVIFIYQVSLTNRQGFVGRKLNEQLSQYEVNPLVGVLDDQLSEVVLVQRSHINQKNRYIKLLEKNLQEMKRRLIEQQSQDTHNFQQEMQVLVSSKDNVIGRLNAQYEQLKVKKKELEMTSQSDYTQLQNKNQKMLQDIQALYEKKLALQNKKYFQLEGQFQAQKDKQDRQKSAFKARVTQTLQLLKGQFIDYYRKAQRVHAGQQQIVVRGQKEFTQKVSQIQDEHESQLHKVTASIVHLQHQKNKNSIQYITNIQSLKRQCRLLDDDIIRYMSQTQMLIKDEMARKDQLLNITSAINQKKQQLLAKQEALRNREERVSQYQQRIVDLQKKKEVLGYRTWQMRQEIQPREDQIQFLKEEIFAIQKQFQKLLNDQKMRQDTDNRLTRHKERLGNELGQQRQLTKQKQIKLRKLCDSIQRVVQSKVTDRHYYQTQMKQFYAKYNKYMSEHKRNNQNPKGPEQIQRHIGHIDQQIEESNKRTEETLKIKDIQIQRTTFQNSDLIKQLVVLRQQRDKLTNELKNTQKTYDNLNRQIKQIKNINTAAENETQSNQKNQQEKQLPPISNLALTRSNSQPAIKGRMSRGVNYDQGSLSIFTKAKLKDLEGRLEAARMTLRQKEIMGRMIQQKIEEHLKKQSCGDKQLRRMVHQYEI